MPFKNYVLGCVVSVTLFFCFSSVWLADQYFLYDAINKGAAPEKMAALRCGSK